MALDIYSKGTTDTLLAAKLDLAGGTMTGGLTLSASGIIFSDSTYLTTAPAGSTLAADQLTAGVVTANPTAGPTASGDVLQYDGSALVWAPGGGGTPFNGGAITNPITIAGATIDSEMSSDFFGVELSADTSKGSVLYYTGLDTYDGSSHMLVGPTGLTFPDATTQSTAGYPNSNPSGFQTASDVSTYVTGLGYLTDAPVDGFAYNRKNGAWEIAGSGGSVAWGAISGTLSDQTDLQTALNAKWTPESGDLSLGGYSITNGNVDCSAGYVTAQNFTVTSGGSITFPDTTVQTTAWTGVAPGKTVNNIDMSSADYYIALTDANNIVNVSAGDGSASGKFIYITAESSVNFPVGTQILFTVTSGGAYNYINADSGVTVIQSSSSLNYGMMRTAVKLGSDLWMISSQI